MSLKIDAQVMEVMRLAYIAGQVSNRAVICYYAGNSDTLTVSVYPEKKIRIESVVDWSDSIYLTAANCFDEMEEMATYLQSIIRGER